MQTQMQRRYWYENKNNKIIKLSQQFHISAEPPARVHPTDVNVHVNNAYAVESHQETWQQSVLSF